MTDNEKLDIVVSHIVKHGVSKTLIDNPDMADDIPTDIIASLGLFVYGVPFELSGTNIEMIEKIANYVKQNK